MESQDPKESVAEYVVEEFEATFLPSLMDFVRIPNLSPLFDPEWNTNGLQMKACDHLKAFADGLGLTGYKSRVFKEDNRTPVLFLEIDPFKHVDAKTVLCYAHMDKQPWGDGWDDDKNPTEPVIQNDKLYGRGGADDGYGMYAALLAVKACQDNNLQHPRVYVMVEASEESSEDDLIFYINKFVDDKVFEHSLDLVVALDSETVDENTFTSTSSLRGIINFDLKVEAFKDNIHSGNSGIFADTFTVATDLIGRLENKETYLMIDQFQVDIPEHRIEEAKIVAEKIGSKALKFPALGCIKSLPTISSSDEKEQNQQQLLNSTWKSALSVIGAEGLPACSIAGNCLRKSTTLTISIRTPPTMDAKKMFEDIKEIVTKDVPFDYKVSIERPDIAAGWDSKELSPELAMALNFGVNKAYGSVPILAGCGGAIPFAGILGEKFPEANFLVTGASLPDANAHGPNENLDLGSVKRLITALALMFTK